MQIEAIALIDFHLLGWGMPCWEKLDSGVGCELLLECVNFELSLDNCYPQCSPRYQS